MPFDLDHALRYLIASEGSDLHLKIPSPPLVRLHGELEPIPGTEPLSPEDTIGAVQEMLHDPNKLAEFEAENEVDFSYSLEGLARFRVNAFHQRGTVSVVMRAIPVNIKSVEELNLPPVISRLAEEERGIILLTGTTGSGKSTTLAAMIDHMNRTMHKHIVTIEDPIEFLHRDRNSIINQREVGQDTASFKRALRRVLRQDPDVILVGEMRDEETVHTALSAAETGHLVLSTLHTVDAPETINRIIDFFPPHQQQQARAMIAGTLKGIVSQRLVRTPDGKGRVATCEIMVMTGRVHDMIIDPKQTGMLSEVVAEGGYYGMQTFDQHLLEHVNAGRVTMEDATRAASSPHDFKLMIAAQARISPRSHPNKGEGKIEGPPADGSAVPPAPSDVRAARDRRAGPGGSPGRAAGGSAGARLRRLRLPPRRLRTRSRPCHRSRRPPPRARRRRHRRRRPASRPESRLTHQRPAEMVRALLFPRRKDLPRADDPRAVQRDPVDGRLRASELEAAEGVAPAGHDPGEARLDGGLPGRRQLRARRVRRHRPHAQEGGQRRGDVAHADERHGRGVPGRPGAGHPPDLPRERHDHGQRPEPARVRRRHRLGHPPPLRRRRGRDGRRPVQHGPAPAPAGWRSSPTARPCSSTSPQAPTFADAQAAITWSSGVTVGIKTDFKMKNLIGRGSGESIQIAFSGQGWALVQPSEGRIVPVSGGSSGGGLGNLLNG